MKLNFTIARCVADANRRRKKYALRTHSGLRHPGDDMRSINGAALPGIPAASRRPSSRNTISPTPHLRRTATTSDGGHTPANGTLNRHTSRGSRTSRTSYEQRGAINPVSSNFDYPISPVGTGGPGASRRLPSPPSSFAMRPQGAAAAALVAPSGLGTQTHPELVPPALGPIPAPPVPPPLPAVIQANATREIPMAMATTMTGSTSSISLPGSASHSYSSLPHGFVTCASPYDHNHHPYRRAVSPVSLSDHPYAHAQPVRTGERPGGGGAGNSEVMLFSSGPSSHGHGHGHLQSVEENSYESDEGSNMASTVPRDSHESRRTQVGSHTWMHVP